MMHRSLKHKSSKHSSKDKREFSYSEGDFMVKDPKAKDESTVKVSKDSSSRKKRNLDLEDGKDVNGFWNGEYSEENGSSMRRK